jgi:hypothetical protein
MKHGTNTLHVAFIYCFCINEREEEEGSLYRIHIFQNRHPVCHNALKQY